MAELNAGLVEEFAEHFYGYGNFSAPIWYIGVEEGGGETAAELSRRFSIWAERGKHELEDLIDYHRGIEVFDWQSKVQDTWRPLIRIQLQADGNDIADKSRIIQRETILAFQNCHLGRNGGNNALINLLPLPSPGKNENDWLYSDLSDLPQLSSRSDYERYYLKLRADRIRENITRYKPHAVIFHGSSKKYRYWWNYITENAFSDGPEHSQSHPRQERLLVLIRQPRTTPDSVYDRVGREIRKYLSDFRSG